MGITFTGNGASYPAAISGPEPGDTVTAESVTDGDTLLADRTEWLREAVDGRGIVIECTRARSTPDDDGPDNLQDMKAITTWTNIPGVTCTTTEDVADGDQVIVTIHCHVRHKRSDAGVMGLRLVINYELSGTPTDAVTWTRRWVGDPAAASDLCYIPIEIMVRTVIAPTAGGTLTARLQGILSDAGNSGDDIYVAAPWEITITTIRYPESGV